MKAVGLETDQPSAPEEGGVDDSVIRYSLTAILSEAVKAVIGTLRLIEGDVTVNEFTVGLVISTVTVTGEPYTSETLPIASFAQGYRV